MKTIPDLETSLSNFTSAAFAINDALVVKNKEGIILSWNPAAVRIFGYEASEILGRSGNILSHPDYEDMEKVLKQRLENNEKVSGIKIKRRHKNGDTLNLYLTGIPVQNGHPSKTKGSIEVITIADPMLSEPDIAIRRLAAIVDSSDDAIISKNLQGIITSWNFGARKIFGYTEQEAIGRHITLLIPPELQQEEDVIIGKIRKGERIDHFETIRLTKDGKRLNISLTISPIKNDKGEV